jgi:hypothetical protein
MIFLSIKIHIEVERKYFCFVKLGTSSSSHFFFYGRKKTYCSEIVEGKDSQRILSALP